MSNSHNVGARVFGARPKSKKALREALQSHPGHVELDPTSLYDLDSAPRTVDELTEGTTLYVVGPDPYKDRRWYATVTVTERPRKIHFK